MEFLEPGALTKICKTPPDCTFDDFVNLVSTLIDLLIFLATLFAVAAFVYAGIRLLTSGGDEGAMRDAKTMIGKVIKGYVVILTAWLVVYTITNALLNSDFMLLK